MSRGVSSLWRMVQNLPCEDEGRAYLGDGTRWAFLEWGMQYEGYFLGAYNHIFCMTDLQQSLLEDRDRWRFGCRIGKHKDEEKERLIWSIYNEYGYGHALLYALKNDIYLDDFGGTYLAKDLAADIQIIKCIIGGYRKIEDVFNWEYYENYFEGAREEIFNYIHCNVNKIKEKHLAEYKAWNREKINKRKFIERSSGILGKIYKIKLSLSSA